MFSVWPSSETASPVALGSGSAAAWPSPATQPESSSADAAAPATSAERSTDVRVRVLVGVRLWLRDIGGNSFGWDGRRCGPRSVGVVRDGRGARDAAGGAVAVDAESVEQPAAELGELGRTAVTGSTAR